MILERAIEIAASAHKGQIDKAGAPYILHPLRVMSACSPGPAQIVAVLHDVIEDTDWTIARLRMEGFDEAILTALDAVTKRGGENYQAFVCRAARNPIAREVKLADIRDNMDLSRIASPSGRDCQRIARYQAALGILTSDVSSEGA